MPKEVLEPDSWSCQLFKPLTMSLICTFLVCCATPSAHPDRAYHTKGGFKNSYEHEGPGVFDFLKWRWSRLWKDIPGPDSYDFPLAENDPGFLRSNYESISLTWIGHATVLLQVGGKSILTDPHFSERASPVQWAGPKRAVLPGLALNDLPPIDMVIISHDHYDSLDRQTIISLFQREGGQNTFFFVPLGLGNWFKCLGISRIVELDWWDQQERDTLTITAVPVQHWSKRSLLSQNQSLWAGWVVQTSQFRFFFCGDSGYSPVFKDIGQRLGPFDLSAIPIGAYEPRWFMRYHHISPEEALQVHLDIRSKKSVAIHWGTFILTDEPLDEPPKRLVRALRERGLAENAFLVLKHGETIIID